MPPAEDREVARRVRVRERGRERAAVAPVFGLEVAVGRLAHRVELDARVRRQDALQPDAVVLGVLSAEAAAFEVPDPRARWRPSRGPARARRHRRSTPRSPSPPGASCRATTAVLEVVFERDLHRRRPAASWTREPARDGAPLRGRRAGIGGPRAAGRHARRHRRHRRQAHDATPNVSHRRTDLSPDRARVIGGGWRAAGSSRAASRPRCVRDARVAPAPASHRRAPNCTPLRCAPHGFLVNEGPSSHAPDPLSHPAAALAAQALVGSRRRDGDRAPLCRGGREPPREERRDHRARRGHRSGRGRVVLARRDLRGAERPDLRIRRDARHVARRRLVPDLAARRARRSPQGDHGQLLRGHGALGARGLADPLHRDQPGRVQIVLGPVRAAQRRARRVRRIHRRPPRELGLSCAQEDPPPRLGRRRGTEPRLGPARSRESAATSSAATSGSACPTAPPAG